MRDVPFCKMNARQAEQDSRDQKGEKQNMKLYDLRTEYRENPRGLSVECPDFHGRSDQRTRIPCRSPTV